MKQKLFIIVVSFVLLLTSCVTNPEMPGDHSVEIPLEKYDTVDVTYSESIAQYGFRLDMHFTKTEAVKYYFEPSVAQSDRNACIEVTEKVLANLDCNGTIPEIYVFSQDRYDYKYIEDHKLYCSAQSWKSVAYITDVLLTAYGESAHFGTAFGYANYLAGKYEWDGDAGRFINPCVTDILDLHYLCFDENFATDDDVLIAKEISCDFVNSFVSLYGEKQAQKLLTSQSDALKALSSYYAEKGISYTPSTIQYGYGGKSYDYIVYSDYGTFYIAKDWVDLNAASNPLITEGFLHTNYANTKTFFEINIAQMKQYQELFGLDNYDNSLKIVLTKPLDVSKYSFYQTQPHRIYLYNVDSLMHEYIHALTRLSTAKQNWQIEGFARYFSYYYDEYGIAFLNQHYNHLPDSGTTKYVHEYLATINRPIDMAKDYRELENIAVFSFGLTDPDASYLAGSSFVQYLVNQYGEEAVINSIYGNGDALPKSFQESVREWQSFIDSHYGTYSKYE